LSCDEIAKKYDISIKVLSRFEKQIHSTPTQSQFCNDGENKEFIANKNIGTKSKIRTVNIKDLQNIFDESSSKDEVFKTLGISQNTYSARAELRNRVQKDSIKLDKFIRNACVRRKLHDYSSKPTETILIEDSKTARNVVRNRILKEKLIEYACSLCGYIGKEDNNDVTLHLDHVNGINNDHRLENLRFLCPACHSQTETFTGRNIKDFLYKEEYITRCLQCNKQINSNSKQCNSCAGISKQKLKISKEELEELINTDKMSFVAIGKKFGVTDNTIRKRCETLGIPIPKKRMILAKKKKPMTTTES
jgi:5-methylcytosine-specific restriction endonuclease McrA